jgi:hypothetical protein
MVVWVNYMAGLAWAADVVLVRREAGDSLGVRVLLLGE